MDAMGSQKDPGNDWVDVGDPEGVSQRRGE
jgi:hypothetical protein